MENKHIIIATILAAMAVIGGCQDDENGSMTFSYTFSHDAEGWSGDFADYPIGQADSYQLLAEHAFLPAPLNTNEGAFMVTGSNQSDDLFMFIKRKITGLSPGADYSVGFQVEFASDVADGMVGIGGSPGESVFLKAGATQVEPMKVEASDGYYRMNIDKGNQSQGGEDMIVIGDFSNDTDQNIHTLVTRSNDQGFRSQADSSGELWIVIGTDSGFEGTTTIYYNTIHVSVRKI